MVALAHNAMIGIAITERNRPEVFKKSLSQIKKFMPKGAKLVIVDDASDAPVKGATFRFEHNAGIAAAKNKCLELLEDCEHIFLFDSDTYPIRHGWHSRYIESGVKHLSFTFHRLSDGRPNGRNLKREFDGLREYGSPCGCMLYIHRDVVNAIGGFDVDYPQWGIEHVDFSNRAHNAGLISAPYLDICDSLTYFHSMDYFSQARSSVSSADRAAVLEENRNRFKTRAKSSEKMPYSSVKTGVILGAYLNAVPDPQRGIVWTNPNDELKTLIDSSHATGSKLKLFIDGSKHDYSPNVYRWFIYHEWLKANPHDFVWMVDSTDVEVLRNPFVSVNPEKLYVGNEYNMRVDNDWMRRVQEPLFKIPEYRAVISANSREVLPNCGIVGGGYDVVMEYLEYRVKYHSEFTRGVMKSTDMAIFNYIVWKHFKGRTTSGVKVNTRFKRFERNNISFFRHK